MSEELDKDLQEFVNEMFECMEVGKKYPALARANKRLKILDFILKNNAAWSGNIYQYLISEGVFFK